VSSRGITAIIAACLLIGSLSTFAVFTGLDETRLALAARRGRVDLTAEELPGQGSGVVAVVGCMRHDIAVAVSKRRGVFRVGTDTVEMSAKLPSDVPRTGSLPSPDEIDRVFTPLAAAGECEDDKLPARIYGLVEEDSTLGGTLTHVYKAAIAPPSVRAIVSGVAGYGTGHTREADRARHFLSESLHIDAAAVPLIVKGRQPGVLWVALVTLASGAHGYLLCVLAVVWSVRKSRRRRALLAGETSDEEEAFFRDGAA
jgi:hypothetical protein